MAWSWAWLLLPHTLGPVGVVHSGSREQLLRVRPVHRQRGAGSTAAPAAAADVCELCGCCRSPHHQDVPCQEGWQQYPTWAPQELVTLPVAGVHVVVVACGRAHTTRPRVPVHVCVWRAGKGRGEEDGNRQCVCAACHHGMRAIQNQHLTSMSMTSDPSLVSRWLALSSGVCAPTRLVGVVFYSLCCTRTCPAGLTAGWLGASRTTPAAVCRHASGVHAMSTKCAGRPVVMSGCTDDWSLVGTLPAMGHSRLWLGGESDVPRLWGC